MSTHICSECSKEFNSKFALQGHSKIHKSNYIKNPFKPIEKIVCSIFTKEEFTLKTFETHLKKLRNCKNCEREFIKSYNSEGIFCSHSCSATITNKTKPKMTQNTKDKISKALKNKPKNEIYNKNKTHHIKIKINNLFKDNIVGIYTKIYFKKCHHCKNIFVTKSLLKYCNNCNNLYKNENRNRFAFTFKIFDYPELFNLNLIKEIGFYSPGGKCKKKWNPNGLSRDHKLSVNEAILNNYDPYYVRHPLNCNLIPFKENNKKKTKSSITYFELKNLVDNWEYNKLAEQVGIEPTTCTLYLN